jgi:hypothetical protein
MWCGGPGQFQPGSPQQSGNELLVLVLVLAQGAAGRADGRSREVAGGQGVHDSAVLLDELEADVRALVDAVVDADEVPDAQGGVGAGLREQRLDQVPDRAAVEVGLLEDALADAQVVAAEVQGDGQAAGVLAWALVLGGQVLVAGPGDLEGGNGSVLCSGRSPGRSARCLVLFYYTALWRQTGPVRPGSPQQLGNDYSA